jgi:hypothetical protein
VCEILYCNTITDIRHAPSASNHGAVGDKLLECTSYKPVTIFVTIAGAENIQSARITSPAATR